VTIFLYRIKRDLFFNIAFRNLRLFHVKIDELFICLAEQYDKLIRDSVSDITFSRDNLFLERSARMNPPYAYAIRPGRIFSSYHEPRSLPLLLFVCIVTSTSDLDTHIWISQNSSVVSACGFVREE